MKEKGIKAEDVKNLPPIEEIHGLNIPPIEETHGLDNVAVIFDLLAQSSIHKTSLGDCSLVCDSSNGPISFCSSSCFIANFCCLGDPVLELACQIYEVPSNSNA